MSNHRVPNSDELALLSAFLDGELSPSEEAGLLQKLSQHPALQDALDALADQIVSTQRLLQLHVDDDLIADRVMAEIDPAAMPDSPSAIEHLSHLAVDGACTSSQAHRLDQLFDTPSVDSALAFVAAVDATRAALHVDGVAAVARSLETLPDHVLAKVERTERAWALAAGAVDGQLSAPEESELAGLCGADEGALLEFEIQAQYTGHIAEALRAGFDSPAFAPFAQRAGAAALQAIAATEALQKPQNTAAAATQPPLSLFARLRAALGHGLIPLLAVSVGALAFVVIRKGDPPATKEPDASAFAALQQHFLEVVAPLVLADNRSVPTTELAVLEDNTADVEAIDATSTTMVFSTAESNITVIWVAGLDDDEEQGT